MDSEDVRSVSELHKSLSVDWARLVGPQVVRKSAEDDVEDVWSFGKMKKEPHRFITGSTYIGGWNVLGLCGYGNYHMPHNVEYEGELQENMFHGQGGLIYPLGHTINGIWEKGELKSFTFSFPDGLEYTIPWKYCLMPDRRFFKCMKSGFNPPGLELLTNDDFPKKIRKGCYDTGEGFYDPNTKCVMSVEPPPRIIRIVTRSEEEWIVKNCRRAWDEPTGYRPDLYENWTSGRK